MHGSIRPLSSRFAAGNYPDFYKLSQPYAWLSFSQDPNAVRRRNDGLLFMEYRSCHYRRLRRNSFAIETFEHNALTRSVLDARHFRLDRLCHS
jgi:hypothetical protein